MNEAEERKEKLKKRKICQQINSIENLEMEKYAKVKEKKEFGIEQRRTSSKPKKKKENEKGEHSNQFHRIKRSNEIANKRRAT